MKTRYIFFSTVAAMAMLVACDPVAEDERYQEVEAIEAQRVVLLEEFTGQNCPNCPTAHRTIEALQEQYGSSLIPVSIHAGGFAYAEGEFGEYFQTFKTPEGDAYAAQWNVQSYPSGVVNRTGGVTLYSDWSSLIRTELARPADVDIELSAYANETGDSIRVNTTLRPTADIADAHLQLWVVEDSIVSLQTDGATMLTDYVHNNVYRASVNGVGGTPVQLRANVFDNRWFSVPMRSYWNPRHLSVVGFVYDQHGVQQAIRSRVK